MDESRKRNLEYLFNPRSIGILGASSDPAKMSGRPLVYLRKFGFPGRIYPINPQYKEIAGVPCFPSVKDVPGDIDVLMVIIPARLVLASLEQALQKGVKAAIIISGGFAEVGGEGVILQNQLQEFSRRTGMLLYGPNTTGLLSMVTRTIATFSQSIEAMQDLVPGKTGLITQSGAFGATIFVRSMRVGLRLSHWAATGNEVDLEFCDFLEYMADDPHTSVIAGFMAGVHDGQKLVRALDRAAAKGKPVVILKVGGTEAGARAAKSHTGAIVGSGEAYDAVFRQKGVILARDVDDLIDHALALSMTRLPGGKRLGIMTESGGGGVLLAERAAELGLNVGEIQGSTRERLARVVPAVGSVQNPVDLTGQSLTDLSLITGSMEVMLDAPDFDIIVPFLLMSKTTAQKKALDLVATVKNHGRDKSVLVCWPEGQKEWVQYLTDNGVFVTATGSRCAATAAALAHFAEFQRNLPGAADEAALGLPADRKEKAAAVIGAARRRRGLALNEYESKEVLRAYGVATVKEAIAGSADEAVAIARRFGYPVVAKLLSADILHKTEAGVIALNVKSDDALRIAYEDLVAKGKAYRPDALVQGVLIQEMVAGKGVETIVGVSREEPFGPAIMFGIGGILVEIMKDVSIKVLPVNSRDLDSMVSEIKGSAILKGARGGRSADVAAIRDTLARVAALAGEFQDVIAELDVNPLIALEQGKGVRAVDALVLLRSNETTQ
ncbi:MAG: acetate--CoA ligase family protein [Betaproteobacteria bacterium]|nr:acetate--CoA ligase family protein [Betaproteobacteria bacterium]